MFDNKDFIKVCPCCGRGHGGIDSLRLSGAREGKQILKPCTICETRETERRDTLGAYQTALFHHAVMLTGADITIKGRRI